MKTNFKRQIVSVSVFAVAIIGAMTSNAMNRKSTFQETVQGYERVSGNINNCDYHKECTLVDGPNCTFGSLRMWGRNSASQCTVPLFEIQQQ